MSTATIDTVGAASLRRPYRRRHVASRLFVYVAAISAALVSAGPLIVSVITSFKLNRDLYNPENNPFILNEPPTGDHILLLFEQTPFLTFMWNTIWVGVLVVAITLLLGLPAAYALAREIADNTAPVSVALNRQLLWRMLGAPHPMEANVVESRAMYLRGQSRDTAEGVAAFLEKRDAAYPERVPTDLPDVFPDWDEPVFRT